MDEPKKLSPQMLDQIRARWVAWDEEFCGARKEIAALLEHIAALEHEIAWAAQIAYEERMGQDL